MRREFAVVVLVLLAVTACQRQSDTIAPLPPPPGAGERDEGFPIKPRPKCASNVAAAVEKADLAEITRLAAGGAAFTCEMADGPLPLDAAVMRDDPALVLGLLEAHADPTARWYSHGDRFALQETLETQWDGRGSTHRDEILRILLTHGADPNQRWCPFESRRGYLDHPGCGSRYGVTPLMWAAVSDEPGTTFLLLQAGADATLEGPSDVNALDLAHGEAVFYQLASAISEKRGLQHADMLRYVAERDVTNVGDPWDETPLTRAISGGVRGIWYPPPHPPPDVEPSRIPTAQRPSWRAGRVRALLALGANANTRLTRSGVDWTPLGLAVYERDDEMVRALLQYRADPNARWCVPVKWEKAPHVYESEPGCTPHAGTTALMFASSVDDLTVLGALLERSDVDLELKDWNGRTAIDYAKRAALPDAVYELRRAARVKTVLSRRFGVTPNGN